MQSIAKSLPALTPSQPSTAVSLSWPKVSAERLTAASKALSILMKGRPEVGTENPQYLAEMVEAMAYLTDEELVWLTHPRDGLQTVCRFLPTPADVHGFLRDRRARAEQFVPAPSAWRKIEDDPDAPWNRETSAERKRRLVLDKLGYDPDRSGAAAGRNVTPPCDADVAGLKLKTPAAPPSPYLLALLREQGYPLPKRQDDTAAGLG